MKVNNYIFFFVFLSVICYGQNPAKLTIKKLDCCDSLSVRLMTVLHADTISYGKIINQGALGVSFKKCINNVSASIISFEIIINKEKKQFVKGNMFDFKNLTQLNQGGEITITKCVVKCTYDTHEPKIITLPARKIIVIPSE